MNKYEVMYIILPTLDEESRKGLIEEMNNIFVNFGSEVLETKEMGMRDLAYEILNHKQGFYVLLNVNATNEAVNEFDRVAKIKEEIIRFIIVKDE